jgi:ribosomal protein S18 acetylase RimI-like enzyme
MLPAVINIDLLPADHFEAAVRADLLNAAYVGYYVPMHFTADTMRSVDELYDVDLARSVVAHTRGEPVGMVLLSRRGERGWISGVGVVPAWRQRGVSRTMMEVVLDRAREAGIAQVALEVIAQNTAARALYAGLGFVEQRELLCWRRAADADVLPIPEERLAVAPLEELMAHFGAWHDQPPCWQSEAATLSKMMDRLRGYRLDMDGAAAGYCLTSERGETVTLMDVGINPKLGAVTAGRTLLQALAALHRGRTLSLNNVPVDSEFNRALAALHFLVTIRQMEMRLALDSRPFAG